MAERWEEIAEELESFDIDYYNASREQAARVTLHNGGSFYTPGDFVDAEEACKRIAALEAEVEDYAKQHRLRAGCLQQERDNNERLRNERAALKAEVERLREALEVVRGEIDHMFHSVESFTPGWLARIRNAARKALGDA